MNLQDFKTLTIGGNKFVKLVRASDGLVLFDRSCPQPENLWEIEYNANNSSIFIGTLYAGYFGGQVTISWGGAMQTVTVPSGGDGLQIRHDGIYGTMRIRFYSPSEFFIPSLTSRTMLGIETIRDGGNNLRFRNAADASGFTQPGTFNWTYLRTIDLSRCTAVPYLTQTNYFDQNPNLTSILIPKDMEAEFLDSGTWRKYADRFVTV